MLEVKVSMEIWCKTESVMYDASFKTSQIRFIQILTNLLGKKGKKSYRWKALMYLPLEEQGR